MCAGHSISHVIFVVRNLWCFHFFILLLAFFRSFFLYCVFSSALQLTMHHHHHHRRRHLRHHNIIDSMNYLPLSCHLTNCNFRRKRAIFNLKTLHSVCEKKRFNRQSTYIIFVFICQFIHKYKWVEKKTKQVFFLQKKNEQFMCTIHIY